jgi:hypothetical protein
MERELQVQTPPEMSDSKQKKMWQSAQRTVLYMVRTSE